MLLELLHVIGSNYMQDVMPCFAAQYGKILSKAGNLNNKGIWKTSA